MIRENLEWISIMLRHPDSAVDARNHRSECDTQPALLLLLCHLLLGIIASSILVTCFFHYWLIIAAVKHYVTT